MPKALLYLLVLPFIVFAGGDDIGSFIFHHIGNSDSWHPLPFVSISLPNFMVKGVAIKITLHILMIIFASVIMFILFGLLARRSYKNELHPSSRWGFVAESFIIYVRDEIVVPNIGKKEESSWTPFFLTLFFFLLTLNLLGLVPGMSTVTANINFTVAMSFLVFVLMLGSGMYHNGIFRFFKNLIPSGVPFFVVIILAPIEILGLLTKVFALAIRLCANMSAGHIIILSLLGLISILKSWVIPPISIGFSLFITLIEVLVAFLQAYIFTLLSSLFIGMSIHQEH